MLKKMFLLLFPSLCAAFFSIQVLAQYIGPGSGRNAAITTAAEASRAADDQRVVLEGYLIRKDRHEHYQFQNNSGIIQVEIDEKYIPKTPSISSETKVRITGEIDKKRMGGTEVEVKLLEIL